MCGLFLVRECVRVCKRELNPLKKWFSIKIKQFQKTANVKSDPFYLLIMYVLRLSSPALTDTHMKNFPGN